MNLDLLEKLCNMYGISGDENFVRDLIIDEIKTYANKINIDNLGNIIVYKKGLNCPKKKLLLSAHMDEVGFIVTNITKDGLIKFNPVGGINAKSVCGKSVVVGDNRVPGVIGVVPVHLLEQEERQNNVKFHDLYIDIGTIDKTDAMKYVNLGDSVYFNENYKFEHNIIKSKAIDDRIGCFILINMIQQELPYDMYFSFVVQEEIGLRGAKVAAFEIAPQAAIVVEATTASDVKDISEDKQICKMGQGAVVSFMDKNTIYDKEYYRLFLELAKKNDIKVQIKSAVSGGNDAGAIHSSRSGVRTIAVSVPCRYLHTACSMVNLDDVVETQKIVQKLAESICK